MLEFSSNVLFGAVVEDIETVVNGSRLGIWWDDDQKYYPCTVLEQEREEEMHELFVQYDDGTHECLHVAMEKVCWIKEEDDQNCEDRASASASASASENSNSNVAEPPESSRGRDAEDNHDCDNIVAKRPKSSSNVKIAK